MEHRRSRTITAIALGITTTTLIFALIYNHRPPPNPSPTTSTTYPLRYLRAPIIKVSAEGPEDENMYQRTGLTDQHKGVPETNKNQTFTSLEWSSEGSAVRLNDYTFHIKGEYYKKKQYRLASYS